MIIATALKEVFKGFNITFEGTDRNVQFHYGDQKELMLWIHNRGNLEKYPLVWYVLNSYTEINGSFNVKGRLVLMQVTRKTELNTWRSENTYLNILQPLSNKVKKKLLENKNIIIQGNRYEKFVEKDEPKYGIQRNNDETTGANKRVSTDFVDAKILTFDMIIKPYCIIK